MGLRPTQVMKNASVQQPLPGEPLPFPCHPDRSGGTCGSADRSWKCSSHRGFQQIESRRDDTIGSSHANTVAATMDRPANGLPGDLRDHARLMCDTAAINSRPPETLAKTPAGRPVRLSSLLLKNHHPVLPSRGSLERTGAVLPVPMRLPELRG
jgi:hypothetical protein